MYAESLYINNISQTAQSLISSLCFYPLPWKVHCKDPVSCLVLSYVAQVAVCTWCVRVPSVSLNGAGSVVWSGTENAWATTGSDEPDTLSPWAQLRKWSQMETSQDSSQSLASWNISTVVRYISWNAAAIHKYLW